MMLRASVTQGRNVGHSLEDVMLESACELRLTPFASVLNLLHQALSEPVGRIEEANATSALPWFFNSSRRRSRPYAGPRTLLEVLGSPAKAAVELLLTAKGRGTRQLCKVGGCSLRWGTSIQDGWALSQDEHGMYGTARC